MKKTLFAMAALALCSTAFAANTSVLKKEGQLESYTAVGDFTLNVDKTVEFGEFDAYSDCDSLT